MYQRNLVAVERGGSMYDHNPSPAKYNSKDATKVEFLVPFSLITVFTPHATWNAAAADLYVDGKPVFAPTPTPEPAATPRPVDQIRPGPKVPSRAILPKR
jgi:hypothetical protein